MTRRDSCYLIGSRASKLTTTQAYTAWHALAHKLIAMGEMDMPKYRTVVQAIRQSTIESKRDSQPRSEVKPNVKSKGKKKGGCK